MQNREALDGNNENGRGLTMAPHASLSRSALVALLACGQPMEPDATGPLFFTADLDGQSWQADSTFLLAMLRPPGGHFYFQAGQRVDSATDPRW